MSGDQLFGDPSRIDLADRPRTVSFENPTGGAGAAGAAHGGRKGSPKRVVAAGERVVLADLRGPGRIGHFWLTVPPMPPQEMRALVLEVFYDGMDEPSVSVPVADFFGAPLGRPVPYHSALQSTQEGRGFNSWIPMPFRGAIRMELLNGAQRSMELYYQLDLTLGPVPEDCGLLHATFNRENPTQLRRDFTIAQGLSGPGRFLGCNVGIRILHRPEHFVWYGEGEVKMYLDGDADLPTWCGTGLEDYCGTAWGMGMHQTPYQGVALVLSDPQSRRPNPDLATFYRWHLPDPVAFETGLRVTIQQIGAVFLRADQTELKASIEASGTLAGPGWQPLRGGTGWFGLCERQDDVCATAYVMCRDAQPVPRVDVAAAAADLQRFGYERPSATETMLAPA